MSGSMPISLVIVGAISVIFVLSILGDAIKKTF
jgi:hypothetical protein